jgi:hypothetical protein
MLQTKKSSKVISISLVIALMITLFAGMTFSASAASGYWTDTGNYNITAWYSGPGAGTYTIANELQFAGLAALVNGTASGYAQDSFGGQTINLTADLNLSAHYWVPIGGASPLIDGVPSAPAFSGNFEGNKHTIGGLYIQFIGPASNNSGYGLFGYIDNTKFPGYGIIQDFTIGGEFGGLIDLEKNVVSAVGSAAGYTNASIYNVHNEINVILQNESNDSSMLGGIAGTVENPNSEGDAVWVQLCSNTGDVSGRGRVGGIVGAVYANFDGGVVVDQCYNRGVGDPVKPAVVSQNTITSYGDTRRSYAGGIVGYCQGFITNCYSYAKIAIDYNAHYQAGIVGILQGREDPHGALSNSYAITDFDKNADPDYDAWLVSSVDTNDSILLENSLWVDTYAWSTHSSLVDVGQDLGLPGAGWGYWTNVGYFYDVNLPNPAAYDATEDALIWSTSAPSWVSANALKVLNNPSTHTLADCFLQDTSGGINSGYPYLKNNP